MGVRGASFPPASIIKRPQFPQSKIHSTASDRSWHAGWTERFQLYAWSSYRSWDLSHSTRRDPARSNVPLSRHLRVSMLYGSISGKTRDMTDVSPQSEKQSHQFCSFSICNATARPSPPPSSPGSSIHFKGAPPCPH